MKGTITAVLIIIFIGIGGAWYYISTIHSTAIGNILDNPRDYTGKEIAVAGTVKERFSFFVVKYFIVEDATGTIPVVTERTLPAIGSRVRVTGQVTEGFSLGARQMIVFVENPQ